MNLNISGVVANYFLPRWKKFIEYANQTLTKKIPFNKALIKNTIFLQVEEPFTFDRTVFPTQPQGTDNSIKSFYWNNHCCYYFQEMQSKLPEKSMKNGLNEYIQDHQDRLKISGKHQAKTISIITVSTSVGIFLQLL